MSAGTDRAGRTTTLPERSHMHRYLSRTQFAERIGVKTATLSRYKLPPADAMIGTIRGWKPATIDQWQQQRRGKGWRKAQ